MSEFKQIVKEGGRKVWSWIKRFALILSLLFVAGVGVYVWVSGWTYSEGTRAGYLVKISRKGVLFKTYEGQLNLGGFQMDQETGLSGNIWSFSVRKQDIYQQLQAVEGQKVKLHYRQRYRSFPWQGKTVYFVYQVDPVRE